MELTLSRRRPEIRSVWSLDPVCSFVTFSILHRGISRIRGRFDEVGGSLHAGEPAGEDVSLLLTLQAGSVNTGHLLRDSDLRSDLFLDAPRHPAITYTGTRIVPGGNGCCRLEGRLSLHGIDRPLAMRAVLRRSPADAAGCERLGLRARARVDRRLFGIGWTRTPPAGCGPLGRHVGVCIDAQFIRAEGVYRVA